ncbi:Ricin-type beta-trefoil lectin domain-like [Streptomyces sp. OV198]|uniref:RICIN domain-containing protein n=1 Tax=Streptomyces sp. OV198 TaxID=1882787 RepID=UPI000BCABB06|nr:RICIN domain-containing protein [Streptomyces sp. OV198]SOE79922.1 Ricin-type beta-trefoil lectin domain-like [Streptomyces sp. OV198]
MSGSLAVGRRRCVAVLGAALLGAVMSLPGAATAAEQSAHSGVGLQQAEFPPGYFFIRNYESNLVLDIADGSTAPGGRVILWDRKPSDNDNQLWKYDEGFLVNKKSGLVLEVPGYENGGSINPGTVLVQNKRREQPKSLNQLWAYNYGYLMPYDPKVVVSAEGDNLTRGTAVAVDRAVDFPNNIRQQWTLESP